MAYTKKTKKTQTKEQANPPIEKIRIGLINAAIWERQTDKGLFYSVTFERRYRDSEGNWRSAHNYDADDLLAIAKAADLAHSRILELRNGDAEEAA